MKELVATVPKDQTQALPEAYQVQAREQIAQSFGAHLEEFSANKSIREMVLLAGYFLPQNPPNRSIETGQLIYSIPTDPSKKVTHISYGGLEAELVRITSLHQAIPRPIKMPTTDHEISWQLREGQMLYEGEAQMEVTKFILKPVGNHISVVERRILISKEDGNHLCDYWVALRIDDMSDPKIIDQGPTSSTLTKELVAA